MAVQQIKKGYLLTLTANEDELVLQPPFNDNGKVVFTNVSGTSKFGIGGPMSDVKYATVTTAGSQVELYVNWGAQAGDSASRIHCQGVGTWRVNY